MENNEEINNNKNNFPINRIEQKETKNIYSSLKNENKKENLMNKEKEFEKEDQNENNLIKPETEKENIDEIKNENENDIDKKLEEKEEKNQEEEKEEEKEEQKEEEKEEKNEEKIEEKKDEQKEERKEEQKVEQKEEQKENKKEKYKKEEEQEEKKEEENMKEPEEINKIFNKSDLQDTSLNKDNDVAKELKIKFNKIIKDEFEFPDKLPLIKNGSYLTELPLISKNKKDANVNKKNKYKESSKVIKYLKEKELSLNKEILDIKDKKDKLINISYSNLGFSDIEKNKNNFEKKKLQTLENNLIEKLKEVKIQIKGIIQREKILKNSKSEYVQNFIKKYENEESSNFRNYLNNNKKFLSANSHKEENNIKEIILDEKELEKKQGKSKDEKREEKRKEKIRKEILKLEKHPSEKNYLFFKMANNFEEKMKLIYKNQKQIKKIEISGSDELKKFYQKYQERQKELKLKSIEKMIERKKEWRANSLLLPKYKSPIMKEIAKNEEKLKIEEEKSLEQKKNNYINKKNILIPLPKISDKLRKENLKQIFNLNDLQGKERVQYIKDEENKINKFIKRSYDIKNKRYKQSNILKKQRIENMKSKNEKKKTLNKIDYENNKKEEMEMINYLEISKRRAKKNTDWDKYLYNERNKAINIKNIQGQIEGLDNNVEMKKEMLKFNGGFLNNQKLGSELTNLLINSINGKLSILKAMNNSV